MKPDQSSPVDETDRFRTTRWSVVLLSAQSQVPGSNAALAELCRLYWFPLFWSTAGFFFFAASSNRFT